MARFLLVFLLSILFLNQSTKEEVPPFIFTDLDQVAVSLWLAIDAKDFNKTEHLIGELENTWRDDRPAIETFLENSYAPIKLLPMVDNIVSHFRPTLERKDFAALLRLSTRFMREFRFMRSYFRQNQYPLDAFWNTYPIFLEIDFATKDAVLGLFEWQELECLFDEFSCMISDYELLAETNLKEYAPNVDEEEHKAAMLRIYECIADYKDALGTGYREELIWPCNQIGESLRVILRCYALESEPF